MSTAQLSRAWSDPTFRGTLSEDDLGALAHPAGNIDEELAQLLGGGGSPLVAYTGTCTQTCSCTASQYSSRPCCC